MPLQSFLVLMTLVAVISDYILHPFYPHFFAARFSVSSADHVGYYFSSICFVVMIAFPFWAYISKKIAELNILVYTQFIAGILAIWCFYTSSYGVFWTVSLIMVFFKGSYLLIYPYTLKVVPKEKHHTTIGILSVVVHLGGILGAVLGGAVLDYVQPTSAFLIMAIGDFIQMFMSIYLLKSSRYNTSLIQDEKSEGSDRSERARFFILKIGLVTMLLYFSDFLIRPFFTRYWEAVTQVESTLITGVVYAIPGVIALLALWYNTKSRKNRSLGTGIFVALVTGITGLFLQGIENEASILVGRIIYGWAIFQSTVQFDLLLFESSTPEDYAVDYSKVHFMQSSGVLIASTVAGLLVYNGDFQLPFQYSLAGLIVTVGLFVWLFRHLFRAQKKKLAHT